MVMNLRQPTSGFEHSLAVGRIDLPEIVDASMRRKKEVASRFVDKITQRAGREFPRNIHALRRKQV
jgi:hypothetical protein